GPGAWSPGAGSRGSAAISKKPLPPAPSPKRGGGAEGETPVFPPPLRLGEGVGGRGSEIISQRADEPAGWLDCLALAPPRTREKLQPEVLEADLEGAARVQLQGEDAAAGARRVVQVHADLAVERQPDPAARRDDLVA